jgi:hypothetical protein
VNETLFQQQIFPLLQQYISVTTASTAMASPPSSLLEDSRTSTSGGSLGGSLGLTSSISLSNISKLLSHNPFCFGGFEMCINDTVTLPTPTERYEIALQLT